MNLYIMYTGQPKFWWEMELLTTPILYDWTSLDLVTTTTDLNETVN